jgi:hypothetical protein
MIALATATRWLAQPNGARADLSSDRSPGGYFIRPAR